MVVFLLSGLWHGAAWTFVAWGGLHGLYLLASRLSAGPRERIAARLRLDRLPRAHAAAQALVVFNLVAFAWIFFRAPTFGAAAAIVGRLAALARVPLRLDQLLLPGFDGWELGVAVAAIGLVELVHFVDRRTPINGFLPTRSTLVRWPAYLLAIAAILVLGHLEVVEFVYGQF
jgi:hypothetical protein